MRVLFATSEAYPFISSGGLGDVSAALPKQLKERFVGCRVVLPLYEDIPESFRQNMKFLTSLSVPVSWRRKYCGVFEYRYDGVIYYFLDNQYYFKRKGLYGYYDDAERFAFFSRAVLEMMPLIRFMPDILHCNDWQTALISTYLSLHYKDKPGYDKMRTLMTIHNIQYQGIYGHEILEDVYGIPSDQYSLLEYDGSVNTLKGGIETAHGVSTVSPTYAKQVLDPWYSHGLDHILRERSYKLQGILNGIDTVLYNPATDETIFEKYSAEDLTGKAKNKQELQKQMGLPAIENVPLIGIVSRLVEHKGIDLIKYAFEEMLCNPLQFIILGSGNWVYENFFEEMMQKYPDKVAFRCGFIPDLARKIYAGADLFLMPSQSEPCGLAQMIALRYGTIPVVRQTGGLKDTVSDMSADGGNGFTFQNYNARDMAAAVYRGLDIYNQKELWNALVQRAMQCDNSWKRSAGQYIRLYKSLLRL